MAGDFAARARPIHNHPYQSPYDLVNRRLQMPDATNLTTAVWLLFTVSSSGNVSTAGFPTKALCEDGASLALTGHTVAENKEIEARNERDLEAWHAAHPPRMPKTETEKELVKDGMARYGDSDGTCMSTTADGLVQDEPSPCVTTGYVGGASQDTSFKVARCFRNDDDK